MTGRGEYDFACPNCEHAFTVDSSMKDLLIEHGCVICGMALSPDAFTSVAV